MRDARGGVREEDERGKRVQGKRGEEDGWRRGKG